MPYVEKYLRKELDVIVGEMSYAIKVDGDLNYVLFKFCKNHVHPSYSEYKNFIGELNECVAEIRRRLLAPYENKKIIDNGDVL